MEIDIPRFLYSLNIQYIESNIHMDTYASVTE